MIEFDDKPDLAKLQFKSRGMGRQPGEVTRQVCEKAQQLKVGRENGVVIRGDEEDIKKKVMPALTTAKKQTRYVLRTETLLDGSGILLWRDQGEWQPQGPRQPKAASTLGGAAMDEGSEEAETAPRTRSSRRSS